MECISSKLGGVSPKDNKVVVFKDMIRLGYQLLLGQLFEGLGYQ